jgi:antitoxin CptB
MDLLMGTFADKNLPAFGAAQLDLYEQLLELSDPDLYNWMTGREAIPPEHSHEVMKLLAQHRFVA